MLLLLRDQEQEKESMEALVLLLPAVLLPLHLLGEKQEQPLWQGGVHEEQPSETGLSQKLVWRAWNYPPRIPLATMVLAHREKGREMCRIKALDFLIPKLLLQLEISLTPPAVLVCCFAGPRSLES